MGGHCILIIALFLYAGAALLYFARKVFIGNILVSLGIVLNTVFLVLLGYVEGTWYFALSVNEVLALPLFLALIALFFFLRGEETPGRIVAIALVLCSLAAFLPAPVQLLPSVKEQVLVAPLFFLIETVSISLFIAGAFLALADIVFPCETDRATRQCILWGFVLFTISQVLGAVWAFIGWSFPFSWSARHLASASTWCLYAALMHISYARIPQRIHAVFAAMGLIPISFIVFHHELSRWLLSLTGIAP